MGTGGQVQGSAGFGPAGGQMPLSLGRIDIASILSIAGSRRGLFAGVVLVGVVATIAALTFIVPTYTASAELMIEVRKNTVAEVNSVLGGLPTDEPSIQNQIQILTSTQLARRVITQLGLQHDPEFAVDVPPGAIEARLSGLRLADNSGTPPLAPLPETLVSNVLKRILVTQSGLSTTLTVSATSRSAEKSARIANAWVDVYIEEQLTTKHTATRAAVSWLSDRVRELAEQAERDEAAVQRYKSENDILEVGTSGSLVDQQAATVNIQLINARAEFAQKKALSERARHLEKSEGILAASQVIDSPVIIELRNKEADLARQEANLSARYLSQHPKLTEVTTQRAANRDRLEIEVRRGIERLTNDAVVAEANVRSLEESLSQVQSRFRDEGEASIKLKALRSIAASSRTQYEALLSRLKAVQGQEGLTTPDAHIVSRAGIPVKASPSLLLIGGLSVPLTLGLAFFAVFLAEGLQPRIRSREQVMNLLGLPVLACVPDFSHGKRPALAAATLDAPGAPFARSMHAALMGLGLVSDESDPKTILVTSASDGEGKTVTAVGLARTAARYGRRTLLIDANWHYPAVAHAMGLEHTDRGIRETLVGGTPLEKAVVRDEQTGADVLVNPISNSLEEGAFGPKRLRDLLSQAARIYELVIIDTASLSRAQDGAVMSKWCDATVLVVQQGRSSKEAVISATQLLTRGRLAGVVLTRCNSDSGTK